MHPASMTTTPTTSRNDLYSDPSHTTVPPPPPPLFAPGPSTPTKNRMHATATTPTHPARHSSPRTSSFFDVSGDAPISPTPSPAPRLISTKSPPAFGPSPLSLSRASSLRNRGTPPPPHIKLDSPTAISTGPNGASDLDEESLSLLHKSPSLLPSTAGIPEWTPPLPRFSDVSLRFSPTPPYLLGEGRYSEVFLASFKPGSTRPQRFSARGESSNGDASGQARWTLCAAKRMAADRASQTMGLREAFFLNRLSKPEGDNSEARGSVYIIKLIAVKEEYEAKRTHGRSTSEAFGQQQQQQQQQQLGLKPRAITRQRSSTFEMADGGVRDPGSTGNPVLAQLSGLGTSGARGSVPSISRLVLLMEHAELGTVDRLLRTSPRLVGRQLWERWARECVEALVWVHSKGVVHADIKPGNLLLTHDLHIRLSDFGSSLLVHPSKPPTDGVGLGTLPFSPPELVNPALSFSFPIDVFALGATLYQCVTGREPFRGCRPVEIMHHVKKGDLWVREEHIRLSRIGTEPILGGSPYPSAWRDPSPQEGIRRGGSLRIPTAAGATAAPRPRLDRMSSGESLRASNDLANARADSPAGAKLWAKWIKQSSDPASSTQRAMTALLSEEEPFPTDGKIKLVDPPSRQSSLDVSPITPTIEREEEPGVPPPSWPAYEDGAPAMVFLDGQDALGGDLRDAIRLMVQPLPDDRPTAAELKGLWDEWGVGSGSASVE